MPRTSVLVRSLALSLCLGGVAFAGNVPVINGSFEDDTCSGALAPGASNSCLGNGWAHFSSPNSNTGTFGEYYPTIPGQVNSVPDGLQVLYINPNGSNGELAVYQDLWVNGIYLGSYYRVAADTTYTFSVYVGAKKGVTPSPARLFFLGGSSGSGACPTPTSGNFVVCSLSFDSADFPSSVNGFLAVGAEALQTAGDGMTLFDNWTVTTTTDTVVPESGTWALMALGIAGIGLRRAWAKEA